MELLLLISYVFIGLSLWACFCVFICKEVTVADILLWPFLAGLWPILLLLWLISEINAVIWSKH